MCKITMYENKLIRNQMKNVSFNTEIEKKSKTQEAISFIAD